MDPGVDKTIHVDDATMDLYFTVQNVFNNEPPNTLGSSGNPGLTWSASNGEDVVGRYFTIGVRGNL